ncbi:hypothetical protein CY34DRAFT_16171 [Suillus luteus UH-Slu-Lm8-n1]|uniref:Uncharacterized protein n=1 Tax=Suillus luteus UH-Slu-Lm8-n1 TaxID=930992 RepID=A0A0D0AF46_9AGAM|nr:hypothetical protein CY34DRAFT_16171 [Suillus luteus UH-Slu-Lm8-n1]
MARAAKNGSVERKVGSLLSGSGSGGAKDSAQMVVDGSDESDAAKEQRLIRAAGKRKAYEEDIDHQENQSQLTCARPSNMPSHVSLGAPVTHRTAKDLTPTFLMDAKLEVSKTNFIRWFIASCSYQCSACARKGASCGYPPLADNIQRNFKCTVCRNGSGEECSLLPDLIEVYIREAYQLDVGEARILASSKSINPQGTLSSYYQTWLEEPAGRCTESDDESRERLKALQTAMSLERPRRRKKGGRVSHTKHSLLQQTSAQRPSMSLSESQPKPQKRVKLIVSLPPEQPPPAQTSPPPIHLTQALPPVIPPAQGSSMPTPVKISPGGSWLPHDQAIQTPPPRSPSTPSIQISSGGSPPSPTTPARLLAGQPPPLSPSTPIFVDLRQPSSPSATPNLAPAKISPPTIAPETVATSGIHGNAPQDHSPAEAEHRHAASNHHLVDRQNTVLHDFNTGTEEKFAGADPLPPSCNFVKLKSETAILSDGLAKLAMEDLSLQADFSSRQEADSYLLKMLQGSLQTCDFLRSIVNERNSRHIAVTRSLEDRICSLSLENGQLKKGVAAKCLEQRICLLEVENDQLRGRLLRQGQAQEDGRVQGKAVQDLEQKIRQLELKTEQLQGRLARREQAIASMNIRTKLADYVLRPTSQRDLLASDDAQTLDPIADTDLRGLISMIHTHLDGIQPTLATK